MYSSYELTLWKLKMAAGSIIAVSTVGIALKRGIKLYMLHAYPVRYLLYAEAAWQLMNSLI